MSALEQHISSESCHRGHVHVPATETEKAEGAASDGTSNAHQAIIILMVLNIEHRHLSTTCDTNYCPIVVRNKR